MSIQRNLLIFPPDREKIDWDKPIDLRRPLPPHCRVAFAWSRLERAWFSPRWSDFGLHLPSCFRDPIPLNDDLSLYEIDTGPMGIRALRCRMHVEAQDHVLFPHAQAELSWPQESGECLDVCKRTLGDALFDRFQQTLPSEAIWRPGFSVRFRVGDAVYDARCPSFCVHPQFGTIRIVARNEDLFDGHGGVVSFLRRSLRDNHWTWVASEMEEVEAYDQDGGYERIRIPSRRTVTIPLDQVLFQVAPSEDDT